MAQHYYPLCWGWEMLGREMGRAAGAAVSEGKAGWEKGCAGQSKGLGSAELTAELSGQIQRDGTTPVHRKLSKPVARQK